MLPEKEWKSAKKKLDESGLSVKKVDINTEKKIEEFIAKRFPD